MFDIMKGPTPENLEELKAEIAKPKTKWVYLSPAICDWCHKPYHKCICNEELNQDPYEVHNESD